MIGLPRSLTQGLAAVLLLGCLASDTLLEGEGYFCGFVGNTMSCGSPERDAAMAAAMLTPAEARSISCPPLYVGQQREPEFGEVLPTPESTTFAIRTPDPALAARVSDAWGRIERWLAAHASATLRKLRFGAEPERLAQWEHYAGRRLPDDLYASYLRHNGAAGNLGDGFRLPGGYGLLEINDIDYINMSKCQSLVLAGDLADADPEHGTWHGSLLPTGTDASGHDLFVEPRTGRVGEAAFGERLRYDGPMGFPSHAAMLEALAAALESGGAMGGSYPTVTGSCELRWAAEPAPLPGGCAGEPRPTPTPTPTPTPQPPTHAEKRATGCLPARRAVVVRTPRAAVTAEVNATWRRIERWLARHAPATYTSLRPPATPLAIAQAEAAMGARFPDDLRASLLRHDGASDWGFSFPPVYTSMSVRGIRRDWQANCDITLDDPELSTYWWHGRLIPFGYDVTGGNLFVDPDTGRTGSFHSEDGLHTGDGDIWPSYLALLKVTARALERGEPVRGRQPRVEKDRLDWRYKD
ncbi:SMI1/KNR4 family protein [Nonomuraea wenchangensis]|uniref:SMI1/KNR4 family protein n=1 Tax=Nonomuraea wenchangensis TaxID=568860 RepID=UPI00371D02CE